MFRLFRRLQWKLTFSYMIATSLVALTLLLGTWAIVWFAIIRSGSIETVVHGASVLVAREGSDYLEQETPDIAGLESWLDSMVQDDEIIVSIIDNDVELYLDRVNYVAVLDTDGNVLAARPEQRVSGSLRDFAPDDRAITAFRSVLTSSNFPFESSYRDEQEQTDLFFIPVWKESTNVVGAIVVSRDVTNEQVGAGAGWLIGSALILPLMCPIALAALLMGLFYGYFSSRGMVKRLKRLRVSAASWAEGDFDVAVKDRSKDEIGQLGRQLNVMADQLETLMVSRGELAALEERNRIARDLHDSAKQQIFATTMQLSVAKALIEQDPSAAKNHISEAEALAKQVQQELSGLIQELRPAQLEGQGLFEAVREASDNFGRRNNIEIDIRMQGQRELPLDIEQALFRIHQEALANVVKHSRATRVIVRLEATNEQVTLTVQDNGIGFDTTQGDQGGMGTHSMRERIEAVGGTLLLKSEPGVATMVRARCPL